MEIKSTQRQWPIKAVAICSFVATMAMINPAMSATDDTTVTDNKIEPKALEALDTMGGFLRSLPAFEVTSDFYMDDVLLSGQKILINGSATLTAEKPNHMYSHVVVDEYNQDYSLYYDGKTFSLHGNTSQFYASVAVPGTLKDLVLTTFAEKGIDLPLADLFLWGTKFSSKDNIQEAALIAETQIAGIPCNHYAYREEGFDWQIWIKNGEKPLPLQLVITTMDMPSHPQYAARLQWNLEPKLSDDMFVLTPPEGASQIDFVNMSTNNGADKDKTESK